MEKEATGQGLTLKLSRRLAAPRETVFRAWTDPAAIKKWFGARGCRTEVAEVELKVGGRYRYGVRLPDGVILYKLGTFREVEPPKRLVSTWKWEPAEEEIGDTLLTVEFLERGRETEVVLTHELMPSEEIRDQHEMGWTACLDGLHRYMSEG